MAFSGENGAAERVRLRPVRRVVGPAQQHGGLACLRCVLRGNAHPEILNGFTEPQPVLSLWRLFVTLRFTVLCCVCTNVTSTDVTNSCSGLKLTVEEVTWQKRLEVTYMYAHISPTYGWIFIQTTTTVFKLITKVTALYLMHHSNIQCRLQSLSEPLGQWHQHELTDVWS